MKDYPYFKAYVAEILFDTMGLSQEKKGDYLDSLLMSWKTMNPNIMPSWMRDYADETIQKSRKLSENAKIRWRTSVEAMQLHTNCNSIAMQKAYIEDRIGEDRIGEERRGEEIAKVKPKAKSSAFIPPSLSEVSDYCKSKGYVLFDVERYFKLRTANNWTKANDEKVKNWKNDVNTNNAFDSFQRKKTPEEIEHQAMLDFAEQCGKTL